MKILNSLYYYRPHYSGLTVYTERLARALVARGHQVSVLTSQFDQSLPTREQVDGVDVFRMKVAWTVSKGPIMPSFPYWAVKLAKSHDLVHLHIPQLDAALFSIGAKMLGKPIVLTYHCDLRLPTTITNRIANSLSDMANRISVRSADVVVANSRDYAEHSAILSKNLEKLRIIPPPIEVLDVTEEAIGKLRSRFKIKDDRPLIGMAARLASEKGTEILANAMPMILERYPNARVLYMGQYVDVIGEGAYRERLAPVITSLGPHWTFLGGLPADELAAFYSICDVTVLPSLNSTESFGMVQVESMYCGTPVVASDIPGVRRPTQVTGMGLCSPPGDAGRLAQNILEILDDPDRFRRPLEQIVAHYSTEMVASQYEHLYEELLTENKGKLTS